MKSNVSDYLEVVTCIYRDAVAKCIAEVSDLRDLETIRSRVESEGLSFLTITLPSFCDDLQKSIANGYVDPMDFRSFRKYRAIPAFLRGMLGQIFDCETGVIYDKDPATARLDSPIIDGIRQICLTFKKVELECTPERVAKTLADFVEIEQQLQTFNLPETDLTAFKAASSMIWDNITSGITLDGMLPSHGPGATAERISGNRKYRWLRWHERLEPFFPFFENALQVGAFGNLEFENVTFVAEADEQPVRVVTVPKTMKGPRVIAIEPVCMQYAQQAIRRNLYDLLESCSLTAGHINFRDQTINQQIALTSSLDGQFATIDLSEASDRVPRSLALDMFRANPDLRDFIDACRSKKAVLPDGTEVPLLKFASMGSALCFPIESMYFYTLCVMALLEAQNLLLTHQNIWNVSRCVYVYGDDLLVPSAYAITVLDYLRKYNCKVNVRKTFTTGRFRESCGVEAYAGEVVTPTYVRQPRPKNRLQSKQILSWVATANLFYLKGYWRTSDLLFREVERILGPLPYVSGDMQGLGRISYLGYRSASRWNVELHRFENKLWAPRPVYRTDELDGYAALQKSLLRLVTSSLSHDVDDVSLVQRLESQAKGNLALDPSDPLHLERSALYGAVAIQRRWVPLR